MKERHLVVSRTARYHVLGEIGRETGQLWYVCHGHGTLASDFLSEFTVLDDGSRVIVAPEALSRFYTDHRAGKVGASWMTREDREVEIRDYVEYLDRLHRLVVEGVDTSGLAVHVLGFSQGAHTVVRWLTSGTIETRQLILWGGLCPPDTDLDSLSARLGQAELVFVRGDRDRLVDAADLNEQRSLLASRGINSRVVTFDGTHRIHRHTLESLAKPTC